MARLAYLSDGYSRYFFDEKEVFGHWNFQGGSIVGAIQTEFLVPALKSLAKAKYADVHPVSGLTGMTLALSAFGKPGRAMLSVPVSMGGHPDTQYVAKQLGMLPYALPGRDWKTVDEDQLSNIVRKQRPGLIYIDQATTLFPMDLESTIRTVRQASQEHVHVHVDTSHVNGLVWGGQLPNPLECGADSYGGSTHKTFPGPHKAVLFTNNAALFDRLTLTAVNTISHHHMSDVIALAITLLEFIECGGDEYAAQITKNSKAFARALFKQGLDVQGKDSGFTRTHQVWMNPTALMPAHTAGQELFEAGLIVNPYDPLPSIAGPGIRMGVNEATKLGLKEEDMETLAEYIGDILLRRKDKREISRKIAEFRATCKPCYCYASVKFCEIFDRICAPFCDGVSEQGAELAALLFK